MTKAEVEDQFIGSVAPSTSVTNTWGATLLPGGPETVTLTGLSGFSCTEEEEEEDRSPVVAAGKGGVHVLASTEEPLRKDNELISPLNLTHLRLR